MSQPQTSTAVMPRWKVRLVLANLAVLIYLMGLFTSLDIYTVETGFITQNLRFVRSLLCLLLALSVGRFYLDKKDRRLLWLSFIFCVVGDAFLIYGGDQGSFMVGVGAFVVVHLLLIRRHADGWKATLGDTPKVALQLAGLAVAAIASVIIFMTFKDDIAQANPGWPTAVTIAAAYIAVLGLSLGVALTTPIRDAIPTYNARMIAVGLILFYVCDVSLGLAALVGDGLNHYAAAQLIPDFTYTPALMLLAASGFDWTGYSPNRPSILESLGR